MNFARSFDSNVSIVPRFVLNAGNLFFAFGIPLDEAEFPAVFEKPFALRGIFEGAAAAAGAWLAMQAVRGLTRPGAAGLFGFCYYNWGQALLSMILFLVV